MKLNILKFQIPFQAFQVEGSSGYCTRVELQAPYKQKKPCHAAMPLMLGHRPQRWTVEGRLCQRSG